MIGNEKRILIWGGGRHTQALFRYSIIIRFKNIIIADKNKEGTFFSDKVIGLEEVDFNNIDVVVISTLLYQEEIEKELKLLLIKYSPSIVSKYS